jgi:ABC-type Na+ transport system ATPase subunit NatA
MSWPSDLDGIDGRAFAVQHLPQCDWVIVMSEGRVVAAGTFAELEEAKKSSPQLQVVFRIWVHSGKSRTW